MRHALFVALLAAPALAQTDLPDVNAPAAQGVVQAEAQGKCPATKAKAAGKNWDSSCGWDLAHNQGPCAIYDPIKSNLCAAREANATLTVDYTYFGKTDCRTYAERKLSDIKRVIIHDGGSASKNFNAWQCRTAASQYTIDDDGSIYQHVGEEFGTPNTGTEWDFTDIGVELDRGGACDKAIYNGRYADKHREQAIKDCEPSDKQYESLKKLLTAIAGRTGASFDVEHVLGHCEAGTSSDPIAFNWEKIGLSNAAKKAYMKKEPDAGCRWYFFEDAPRAAK